ncbi:MAG: ABC transporter permease subunit [Ruminiclostridium sp.]
MEFLLSKPITRNKIITIKILAVLTNIIILNTIISLISLITIELVKNESYNRRVLFLLFIASVFMQITFSAIGFIISIFIMKARVNFPIGVGIVLVCYVISIIA